MKYPAWALLSALALATAQELIPIPAPVDPFKPVPVPALTVTPAPPLPLEGVPIVDDGEDLGTAAAAVKPGVTLENERVGIKRPELALKQPNSTPASYEIDLSDDEFERPLGTATPTPNLQTTPDKPDGKKGLVMAILAGVASLVLLLLAVFIFMRKRQKKEPAEAQLEDGAADAPPQEGTAYPPKENMEGYQVEGQYQPQDQIGAQYQLQAQLQPEVLQPEVLQPEAQNEAAGHYQPPPPGQPQPVPPQFQPLPPPLDSEVVQPYSIPFDPNVPGSPYTISDPYASTPFSAYVHTSRA